MWHGVVPGCGLKTVASVKLGYGVSIVLWKCLQQHKFMGGGFTAFTSSHSRGVTQCVQNPIVEAEEAASSMQPTSNTEHCARSPWQLQ